MIILLKNFINFPTQTLQQDANKTIILQYHCVSKSQRMGVDKPRVENFPLVHGIPHFLAKYMEIKYVKLDQNS